MSTHVSIVLADEEIAIWNESFYLYVPCKMHIAEKALNYEKAKNQFETYAKFFHDHESVESAAVYMMLMEKMDETRAAFFLYRNEWVIAKHGYSLN